ncbi:MAG TPA: hypothetical protein VFT90_04855 [Chryseosolibacter sp.]|nr:hypothetical protein [Chryseosolibacter sp.]
MKFSPIMLRKLYYATAAFLPAVVIVLLAGCSKDEPLGPARAIELSTQLIAINDDETVKATLSPIPNGTAVWEVFDKPYWLTVSPMSGTLTGPVELQFSKDATVDMSAGTYTGELTIISTASGEVTTTVTLTIAAKPEIETSTQNITLSADEHTKSFTIKNIGTGKLEWQVASNKSWAVADATSGFLMDGESATVNIQVGKDTLMAGTQSAILTITSNSITGNKTIGMDVTVPEYPYIEATLDSLGINYFESGTTLKIYNAGNVSYDWSAAFNQNYFTITPASGTLQVKDTVEVTISAVRTGLITDDYESILAIQNNKSGSVNVKATLRNYLEEKWLLTDLIIDAEYDDINNVIIAVNSNMTLTKLNPATSTRTELILNKVPTAVSVSQDGNYAIVGHDGMITYVNLSTMSIVAEHTVSCIALDVILAPNGFAYVFPKRDQWETIRCIKLSTGAETLSTGGSIYAGTKAKLHPNGLAIYGASNNLSPDDFEKYNISSGTAAMLYDSPYHGDYSFGGNLWISENGNLLFGRSGNVFRSTSDQATDMYYAGKLPVQQKSVLALDHSSDNNRVYAIFASWYTDQPDYYVSAFDGTYLTAKGTIDLPKYMEPDGNGGGTLRNSIGTFGFFNADGTKFYIITKNSGITGEYAVVTLNATL